MAGKEQHVLFSVSNTLQPTALHEGPSPSRHLQHGLLSGQVCVRESACLALSSLRGKQGGEICSGQHADVDTNDGGTCA